MVLAAGSDVGEANRPILIISYETQMTNTPKAKLNAKLIKTMQ